MSQLPAVILGSHANALTFARALGRRGVPVWIVDSENALGRYTRYAKVVSLPYVEEQPDAWLETLTALGTRLGTSVLFSTTDAHCLWLARHQTQLRKHFRFLSPDAGTIEQILYKDQQYAAACAAHVPTPRTWLPTSVQDLEQIAGQVTYPCLLKPAIAHRGRPRLNGAKVVVAESAATLKDAYTRFTSNTASFVVQEIVSGGDETFYIYAGLWDASAQERAYVTFHKLRQYPAHFGTGSLFLTETAPRVLELARQLLHELHYVGLAEVEFKQDAQTGEFCLIEMNPRAGTTSEVAAAAGLDLGWLTYRYLCDGDMPTSAPFRNGVRVVDEEVDLPAFLALSRTHALSARGWLRSLRRAKPVIAAWDDPLPLLMGMGRGMKRLVSKP